MNDGDSEITKCPKCGGSEIAKGRITMASGGYASGMVFEPEGRCFFTLTVMLGSPLSQASYACLVCGVVWSATDPKALKDYINKHCKKQN